VDFIKLNQQIRDELSEYFKTKVEDNYVRIDCEKYIFTVCIFHKSFSRSYASHTVLDSKYIIGRFKYDVDSFVIPY
jgi:hypothetical protein